MPSSLRSAWVRGPYLAAAAALLMAALGCGDRGGNKTSDDDDSGAGGAAASSGAGASGGQGAGGFLPDGPLSMMTWNIRQFPLNGTTVERVRDIILQQSPDVLAIQEIETVSAFEDLDALLPQYEAVINDDDGGFLRLGLMTRKDRVTLSEVATLYNGNWYPFPRPPLKARITADNGGYDFVVVVVHLKAQFDQESQDRRREACETLDTWVDNQIADGVDTEFVILGDFNDELTDSGGANVFTSFLDKPNRYTFLTQQAAMNDEFSYVPFESMIDHVLITNDLLDEYGSGSTEILRLDTSISDYDTISDHVPIKVQLVPQQ